MTPERLRSIGEPRPVATYRTVARPTIPAASFSRTQPWQPRASTRNRACGPRGSRTSASTSTASLPALPRGCMLVFSENASKSANVKIGSGSAHARRRSCARSRSLSSHSLLYPSPRLGGALTAVGAQITAPAIAGSIAATPRSSNASRPCRAFMGSARQIRIPERATGEAGPGT